jgi:predicted nucleic acid-binding protein
MNGRVCVDASVAAKWILPEELSDRALTLLADALTSGTTLTGPPHLPIEVTSAIYKRLKAKELALDEVNARLNLFAAIPIDLVYPEGLAKLAVSLSAEFEWNLPYDAFYLAVGEKLDCAVWTADDEFHQEASGQYPRLRSLTSYSSPTQ